MIDTLLFLLSVSGILLLIALVVNVLDKEGKWSALMASATVITSRASAVLLALLVMMIVHDLTGGVLAFKTIGTYIACVAIIWFTLKDMFGQSKLASDLVAIAADKASRMQEDISKKSSELAEEARKRKEETDKKE